MILTEYNEELRKKTLKEEGRAEGVELCANLMKILLSSRRLKDAERAASDKAFRETLFNEYRLR